MRVKELERQMEEARGLKTAPRLVALEAIWAKTHAIEKDAMRDPASITLKELEELREFVPELQKAVGRARYVLSLAKEAA